MDTSYTLEPSMMQNVQDHLQQASREQSTRPAAGRSRAWGLPRGWSYFLRLWATRLAARSMMVAIFLGLSLLSVDVASAGPFVDPVQALGGRLAGPPLQRQLSAPLKPDRVEELLDARATALRALLYAHDIQSAAL